MSNLSPHRVGVAHEAGLSGFLERGWQQKQPLPGGFPEAVRVPARLVDGNSSLEDLQSFHHLGRRVWMPLRRVVGMHGITLHVLRSYHHSNVTIREAYGRPLNNSRFS